MSRFDEFRDSLEEANKCLEGAVGTLTDDDFDNEGDRYDDTHNELSTTCSALRSATEDVLDEVGIRCNLDALNELMSKVEGLEMQAWNDTISRCGDEEYDEYHAREYVRDIRALQDDLADIVRTSW